MTDSLIRPFWISDIVPSKVCFIWWKLEPLCRDTLIIVIFVNNLQELTAACQQITFTSCW